MGSSVTDFTPSDDELRARWSRFLTDYCKPSIHAAIHDHDEQSYTASFTDLQRCDPDLADYTLKKPRRSLRNGTTALKAIEGANGLLALRVRDLPKTERITSSKLRAEHLGRFIAAEGLVKKVAPVRPLMVDAAFECKACHNLVHVIQDEEFLEEPVQCDNCERQTSWRLIDEESRLANHQPVQIQETPEGLRAGTQPERLNVYFRDDLVKTVSPGDRVRVNGILVTEARRLGNRKKTEFEKVLEVVSVEHEERSYEEVELSAIDVERIVELSRRDPYQALLKSFAPDIHGHQEVKEALLMAVFSGVRTTKPDGGWKRGDIHVLLVGDPGVAKSELIFWLQHVAPRCVKTTGKGNTTAGLTASAVKSDLDGEWALEAGALVMADLGLVIVDELDKMSKDDQGAMHPAMEQQELHMNKAGISATMKTRCGVIGAANPKFGRFDPFDSIPGQINMKPALLSRFDFIFSLLDRPNREHDAGIARHMLRQREAKPDGEAAAKDIVPVELFRKYVAYARRYINPVLSREASQRIEDYYVNLRGSNQEGVAVTARSNEAFARASQAVARIYLRDEVTVDDVLVALRVHEAAMKSSGCDPETGKLDADIIATGVSHSQRDRVDLAKSAIRLLSANTELASAKVEDVYDNLVARGVSRENAERAVNELRRTNTVYEKQPGRVAMLS